MSVVGCLAPFLRFLYSKFKQSIPRTEQKKNININKIMVARSVSIRLAQVTQSKQQAGTSDDKRIDLTGIWQGDYGKNGVEIVEIEYIHDHFVATKVYVK